MCFRVVSFGQVQTMFRDGRLKVVILWARSVALITTSRVPTADWAPGVAGHLGTPKSPDSHSKKRAGFL